MFAEYKRDINHIYLVLPDRARAQMETEKDFQFLMLQNNEIAGLLPVSRQLINGIGSYQYDVSARQSIRKYYELQEIGYREIVNLILSLHITLQGMKEYLLEEDSLVLEPDYIFYSRETEEVGFLFYPLQHEPFQKSMHGLSEFLLSRADHNDARAVEIVYQLFKDTRNENFTMKSLMAMIEQLEIEGQEEHERLRRQKLPDVQDLSVPGREEGAEYSRTEEPQIQYEKWRRFAVLCSSVGVLGTLIYVYGLHYIPGLWSYVTMITSLTVILIILFQKYAEKFEESGLRRREEKMLRDGVIQTDLVAQTKSMAPTDHVASIEHVASTEHQLVSLNGGQEIPFLMKLPLTIGNQKECADIVIEDEVVSALHARIHEEEGKLLLTDLNSLNGTYHNGELLHPSETVEINVGDTLAFAGFRFCLR